MGTPLTVSHKQEEEPQKQRPSHDLSLSRPPEGITDCKNTAVVVDEGLRLPRSYGCHGMLQYVAREKGRIRRKGSQEKSIKVSSTVKVRNNALDCHSPGLGEEGGKTSFCCSGRQDHNSGTFSSFQVYQSRRKRIRGPFVSIFIWLVMLSKFTARNL